VIKRQVPVFKILSGNYMESDKATREKIAIDQIQRLTAQGILGIGATAFCSVILAVALYEVSPKPRLLFWICTFLTVCLARIILQRFHLNRPLPAENIARRKFILLLSLFLSGCMWGVAPILLFPYESVAHQVLLCFILGGMVAGAVGVFASIMAAFYTFSIPATLPLMIILFSIGDGTHVAMGCTLAVFWIFMFLAARRLNREIYHFLVLKYENIGLIGELEKEISERKNAEKELKSQNQRIETIVADRTNELRMVNEKLLKEIDDRIEVEKALRESEEKFRILANSLPQIVFETDARGVITFANRNTFKLLGYSQEAFEEGMSAAQILVTENNSAEKEPIAAMLSSKKLEGHEGLVRARDGRTFPVAIHSEPILQSGQFVGARGIIIDLTEKKRAEEEQKKLEARLQRAQKMEMLGTMAGGVAHDLNNILSGIVGYPDLLLSQLAPDSSLRKPIQVMQDSGKKAAAIVQDLLTLTRRGVIAEEVLNLNDIILEYLASPEHEKIMSFYSGVRTVPALEQGLLAIAGSRVHLIKTVMNLVANAAEAMPSGGVIEIVTSHRYLDQPVKGYDAIEEGDYVVMTVADNGMGIEPDDIDRIFEPFFTKKIMGRSGTGLGMAVVWGTVKDHKGYIDVDSRVGQGSRFSLYFPVTRKERTVVQNQDGINAYFGQGETLLIVDDVESQRQIASEMLTQLGYRVEAVDSGEKAIDYLRGHRVDIIVLDMIMEPGMDGLDTYRKILEIHPGQKTIIASGYSETERVREALRQGAGPYIKKPYTWLKLGQAVKAALGSD
jgi:two-component system, cell cycle sensor histidine kinase and response regulator CckA